MSLATRLRHAAQAGPYNPTTVAGLVGYWRGDSIAGVDGDFVATWPDSFAGGNLTATGTLRPTLQTVELNGRSVVRFDGATQWLDGGAITAKHWVAVAKYNGATFSDWNGLITGADNVNNDLVLTGNGFAPTTWYPDAATGTTYHLDGTLHPVETMPGPMNAWGILSFSRATAWALTSLQVGKDRSIGATARLWNGDVASILAFDSPLSNADLNYIGNGEAGLYALNWADV